MTRISAGEVAPRVAHYAKHRPVSAKELERRTALYADPERDDG